MKLRAVANEIDDALDSAFNPGPSHMRDRMVLNFLVRELEATGRLFLADGAPVHLLPDGKTVSLCAGADGYAGFISSCGLPPCDGWDTLLIHRVLEGFPIRDKSGWARKAWDAQLPAHVQLVARCCGSCNHCATASHAA